MFEVSLGHYLTLGAIIFTIGVIGIFLNRKNVIVILMSIELILLAVNINLVSFSIFLQDLSGQIFTLFILTVAAAEAAIGLAIIVVYYRNAGTIRVEEIENLKEEFDYVLCDTPPWDLFVDAKILSKFFQKHIYIVANQDSSFKEIDSFLKDFEDISRIKFFYNKFNLYFNFLWYKYQYPYYSRNYYYDYSSYSAIRKDFTFWNYLVELPSEFKNLIFKWVEFIKKRFFNK